MNPPQWLSAGLASAAAVPLVVVLAATPAAAEPSTSFTGEALTPDERIDVIKAPTSRLAQTDESLLDLPGTDIIPIVVKLNHDSIATYTGEVSGYAATSPAATGKDLTGSSAEKRYEAFLARREVQFAKALSTAVPEASVGQTLRTVYGGVAITVPANKVRDVLAMDQVAAVQADEAREPATDSSAGFVGADSLYPRLGGDANAGKGTIIGIVDSGGWPEHPSFADLGNLAAPPGPARECNYGPDPTTDDDTPFQCNNKLIGGMAFLKTYNAVSEKPLPVTARDGSGHGTHVGSTAAGNVLDEAPVFGVERGPISGVAPGAWIMHYRVCGTTTCLESDSAAAVAQAVKDGVDVINFSISGGSDPFAEPASLAFLDAYTAGVLVATSAGNSGPDAGTTGHVAPWVTTVAASTQTREFGSTVTLTSGTGESLVLEGASITAGVAEPTPVVLASAAPYNDALCTTPAPPGLFEDMIVACERGEVARVLKGDNVLRGGAAGMILYNPTLADTGSDNHYLPTVHLADGGEFLSFVNSHSEVSASFTDAEKRDGQGDVMATFSARGPGGFGIKPDITAPGVQILAGESPTGGDPLDGGGPAGEFFQTISGTSMSSPVVAGAALLLKGLHPEWTPGQIKSALMTTAHKDVVKEDLTTPADPFDYGSGRIDLAVAGSAGLTIDETAENMVALGRSQMAAIHLNLASINAPVMPGRVTTTRTVTNVTGQSQTYRVQVDSPARSRITVSPSRFTVGAGKSQELQITISSSVSEARQLFGEVRLVPQRSELPTQHLPVAFVPAQGNITLAATCSPDEATWFGSSTCTVTATNESLNKATADLGTTADLGLLVTGADGADARSPWTAEVKGVELAGASPSTPSLSPGSNPAGEWLPLSEALDPIPIGNEQIINFDTPDFVYAGRTYDRIGVADNGYLVVGGRHRTGHQLQVAGHPEPGSAGQRPGAVLDRPGRSRRAGDPSGRPD